MTIINAIPLKVTSYACVICKRWHKEGSKKFIEHWDRHFDKDDRYIGDKTTELDNKEAV